MSALHVFDMDGTLLQGTTASLEIARSLGCLQELKQLERTFHTGLTNTHDFARQLYQIWGTLTPECVIKAFDNAPWIRGMREVFADIRERNERSLIITMSPDFFANHLASMGADTIAASRFPPLPFGQQELDTANILSPADKITFVDHALSEHGISRSRCVAYGDSISDVPLFQSLEQTISMNGDMHIFPWARLHYVGEDLRDAYALVRMHCLGSDTQLRAPGSHAKSQGHHE